ncbi:MAG: histidine kinase N-terminal domain-containing protein [Actinobacteria bacterium]|nr:histidine kinase N-terminal domain-containing protein [Actinomycetota bacterium]
MRTSDVLSGVPGLTVEQKEKIAAVSKNIQLLADLGYSDIVVYCRVEGGVLVVAAARPNTASSFHPEGIVGQIFKEAPLAVTKAFKNGAFSTKKSIGGDGEEIEVAAIPIRLDDVVIAVMAKEWRLRENWRPSEMEQMYIEAADDLMAMIGAGVDMGIGFPSSKEAGDGLIRIDPNGIITYASPNAVTIYRRLGVEGTLPGQSIYMIGLNESPVSSAMEDRIAVSSEITEKGMTVAKRAISLIENDRLKGVVAIVGDVTDVRAREQQLKIKEATIREIHHRVKNNLQTIASLLRLQSRRMTTPEAQQALMESVGRISSIAVIHEILSQTGSGTLDFKEIATNINKMIQTGLVQPDKLITIATRGSAGKIPSPMATALALILTELVQNAVEHAFEERTTGKIVITLKRRGNMLTMEVSDNGSGLPENFELNNYGNLGMKIVHTLVSDELGGSWEIAGGNGTKVVVRVPVVQ